MMKQLLVGLLFLITINKIQTANILFLSLPIFSHVNSMTFLAKELHTRGHNSYIPAPERLTRVLKRSAGVHFLPMKDDEKMGKLMSMGQTIFGRNATGSLKEMLATMKEICDNYLLDEAWFQTLESVNASLAIVDGIFVSSCLAIIPYKLSIPYILMGAQNSPDIHRTPWSLAAFPMTMPIPLDLLFFADRMKNALIYLLVYFNAPLGTPSRGITFYAPNKPDITFGELLRNADLYIIESDVLIDGAFPALPNVEYLGGMATYPAMSLEGDLLKFVNSSKHGIIIVSFGSIVDHLSSEHLLKMKEAFGKIKYDVVWKWSNTSYTSPNVFITKWMPQNDLLGHPKTRLFITHCGNGGQFESLYHAVPMLGFPVFGDQPHNAKRIEQKGYGISMDLYNYAVGDLVANINEIISNPKYKNNIKMASDIFKSRPEHPSVRGARIVDDVIKYGGGFMRSFCQDMPLYQYFMLDIFAVVLASLIIVILIAVFILRKCFSFLCRKKEKNE